jgi:hypothetical protein
VFRTSSRRLEVWGRSADKIDGWILVPPGVASTHRPCAPVEGVIMGDLVEFGDPKLRALFCCFLCSKQAAILVSVRVSRWMDMATHLETSSYAEYHALTMLRTRFVCEGCFNGFTFAEGFTSGFLTVGDKKFRMSLAKDPARYDYVKWMKYVARYGTAAVDR